MEKQGIDIRFKRKRDWSKWYRVSNPLEIDNLLKDDNMIISYSSEGVTIDIPKTNTKSKLPLKIKTKYPNAFYSCHLLDYLEIKAIEIKYSLAGKDFILEVYNTKIKSVDGTFLISEDDYTKHTPIGNDPFVVEDKNLLSIIKEFTPSWTNLMPCRFMKETPILAGDTGMVDARIFGFDFKPDAKFKFRQRSGYREFTIGNTRQEIEVLNSCEYHIDYNSIELIDGYTIKAFDKQFGFTKNALKTLKVIKKYSKGLTKGYIIETSYQGRTWTFLQIGSFYLCLKEIK